MKKNYLISKRKLCEKSRRLTGVLLFGVMLLMGISNVFAQTVCSPNIEFTVQFIDATEGQSNAKMVISGVPSNNFLVGFSEGGTYNGSDLGSSDEFGNKAEPSPGTNILGRYLSQTLSNPASGAGTIYTVRVQDPVNNCYTDKQATQQRVNWSVKPSYTDLEVEVSQNAGGTKIGETVTVTVKVFNNNDNTGIDIVDAQGVQIFVHHPVAGLEFTGNATTANGSYDAATKIWTVGTVPAGQEYELQLQYTITARGVFQVGAEVNSATNTEKDLDSIPLSEDADSPFEDEDDEGSICVTIPWDWCETDQFTFQLISNSYAGVQWMRNGSVITGSTADFEIHADGYLIIKSLGEYNFVKNFGEACPAEGCCPITIVEGVRPDLQNIDPVAICLGSDMPEDVVAVDNRLASAYDEDRGDIKYQWFALDGVNATILDGNTALAFNMSALPAEAGEYTYRLVAHDFLHSTCRDSTEFKFVITNIVDPIAVAPAEVCEEGDIKLALENHEEFADGFAFNWYYETEPGTSLGSDSTVTRTNAEVEWTGNYVVRVSKSFVISGITNPTACEKLDTVNVVVNPLPDIPVVIDKTYCEGDEIAELVTHVTDSLNASGSYLNWYLSLDPPLISYLTGSPSIIVPNSEVNEGEAGKTYSYWVTQTDSKGCESHHATFDVIIHGLPEKPKVSDLAYCEGDTDLGALTAVLSANSGYHLDWYASDDPAAEPLTEAPTPTAQTIGVFTWYVTQTFERDDAAGDKSCESPKIAISIHIKDRPDRPTMAVIPPFCLDEDVSGVDISTYLTKSPATTSPEENSNQFEEFVYWQYPGFTANGNNTPSISTESAGSNFGLVWEDWTYNDTLTCSSEQADFRVVVNPLPDFELISVAALCVGDESLNNGAIYISDYQDTDKIRWHEGTVFSEGSANAVVLGSEALSSGGAFASGLTNPSAATTYVVEVENEFGCKSTETVAMTPKDCECPGGYCEPAIITKVP
jgi:hypothetical protein